MYVSHNERSGTCKTAYRNEAGQCYIANSLCMHVYGGCMELR